MNSSCEIAVHNQNSVSPRTTPDGHAGTASVAATVPADRVTPWRFYDTDVAGGMRVRVASSRRDAQGIRDVLRSAWRVGATENYFYESFNNADVVFRDFVEPATRSGNIFELEVLCLVLEARGQILATVSLVFDHDKHTVELGRGAVDHEVQGKRLFSNFVGLTSRLLTLVPDYAVVADATSLVPAASRFACELGAPAVALHPSSFVVQSSCVASWHGRLARAHDEDIAHALLLRSEATGLGRFATAWQLRMPAGVAVYEPHLGSGQRAFHAHTCQVLGLGQSAGKQPAMARDQRISDSVHTATRMMSDPPAGFDPGEALRAAATAGFETLIVQVPCDETHVDSGRRLEAVGGVLSGVFPDARGAWYASYTLFTTAEHRQRALAALRVLCRRNALVKSYMALAQLMLAQVAGEGRADNSQAFRASISI